MSKTEYNQENKEVEIVYLQHETSRNQYQMESAARKDS
jgi:hypothetical protein